MRASAARCVGVGGDAVGVLNRAAVASVRLGRPWPNATVCVLSESVFLSNFDIFFIVGQKGGGGFYVGFLKNGTSIFYGSSVRMGHKIYILPIYSTYILLFHYTMPARIVTSARALNYRSGNRRRRGPPARNNTRHQERADLS